MTACSHDDLNRSLGRLEGDVKSVSDRIDRLEDNLDQRFDRLDTAIDGLLTRMDRQDALENQRKGVFAVVAVLAASIGSIVTGVLAWLATEAWPK